MSRLHPIALAFLSLAVLPCRGLDTSLSAGFAGTTKGKFHIVFQIPMLPTLFVGARSNLIHLLLVLYTANGNIFTITAKTEAVSITSFDINMDGASTPQPAPVEIYFHPGVDPGFASVNFPYTKVFQDNVTGKGKGNVTELPDLTSPVTIPAGSTYSFYITVASLSFGTNIWYNTGVAVGDIVASDQYISIGEGYALGYPFLGYTPKRRWNGELWNSIVDADIVR